MKFCNICNQPLGTPVYHTNSNISITSLFQIINSNTVVYYCDHCTHVQTTETLDIEGFYDTEYKLLVESEEEDQIYSICGNEKIFRYDHQVNTMIKLLHIPKKAKVLDYGCAKATTLKKLMNQRDDITPYLFDVSEMYIPFWKQFTDKHNWAVYNINSDWFGTIDVVTSFFSMEHVASPKTMVKNIFNLLKDDGIFYCVIPDIMQNIADFIVADHINHFTRESVYTLLNDSGFEVLDINLNNHASAMIVIAKKSPYKAESETSNITEMARQSTACKIQEIAQYWSNLQDNIQSFENKLLESSRIAIYGSGFYGTYIASCLTSTNKIEYFIDQDPYRQKKLIFGKKIISPESMPEFIDTVLVGLNPKIAHENIENISSWKNRNINYLYL